MTLCFLNDLGNSKYKYYSKTDSGGKKPEINCVFIVIEVCENNSGKKVEFEYTPLGRGLPVKTEEVEIKKDELDEMYMFQFKINVFDDNPGNEAGNKTPGRYKYEGEKTIRIKAGMKEESGNISWSPASGITMMFCPCAGWTLAEGGQMVQGATGYLIDENGYYILEDGRRVSDEMIIESRYGEKNIRIGDKDVSNGLSEIMSTRNILPAKTVYNDVYEELFKSSQSAMPLVAYQAFQINACYAKPNSIENPLAIGDNAKFYSIGTDETEIPIVVTQVGEVGPDKKKLVIAGPHGDERNAQRLIMSAQKYFIDKDMSANTVSYFIPCLSPTMCFADARGIPIVDIEGRKRSLSDALTITIPDLHNLIASQVPKDPHFPNEKELLRKLIQDQLDPTDPKYGIDANRDVNFILDSSKRFAEFIKSITGIDLMVGTGKDDGICTVFMIHGYDSSKSGYINNKGCVYGQYKPDGKNSGSGVIPLIIIRYIDMITQSLFRYINASSSIVATDNTSNRNYFYQNDNKINKFNGEWIRHLCGRTEEYGISSFDIELGQVYNEQVRGAKAAEYAKAYRDASGTEDQKRAKAEEAVKNIADYDPGKVENKDFEFFKPKQEPEQRGFFIMNNQREINYNPRDGVYPTISFNSFLTSFYDRKKDANEVNGIVG
jgi:hypothetical protein